MTLTKRSEFASILHFKLLMWGVVAWYEPPEIRVQVSLFSLLVHVLQVILYSDPSQARTRSDLYERGKNKYDELELKGKLHC